MFNRPAALAHFDECPLIFRNISDSEIDGGMSQNVDMIRHAASVDQDTLFPSKDTSDAGKHSAQVINRRFLEVWLTQSLFPAWHRQT